MFQDTKFVNPKPAWSAVRTGKLGYGRMQVFNTTHIFYEFMYMQTNKSFDSFWLIKEWKAPSLMSFFATIIDNVY